MLQIIESAVVIAAIGLYLFPSTASVATPRKRVVAAAALVCAAVAGCASATDVTSTDKQGMLTVSASATGGRLAWARAHKRALTEANDYCERRGMQTSLADEQTAGGDVLQQHESVVRFECHPKF